MPVWAEVVLVVIGVLVLLAAAAAAAVFGWRAYTRRLVLRLVVRAEAIEAAGQALLDAVGRLASADDETLAEFATDPESPERRVMHDVSTRAHMLAYEIDRMPLPRSLVPVAEALADAAVVIDREASHVQDPHEGHSALDALTNIDLEAVRAYLASAHMRLTEECVTHGLDDMAVYGGGLYL